MIQLFFEDRDDFQKKFSRLSRNIKGSRAASVINKLTRDIRKNIQTDIRNRYTINRNESKLSNMPIAKRAKPSDLYSRLMISTQMYSMLTGSYRKNTKHLAVRYRGLSDGSYKYIGTAKNKAFITTMKSGHKGVYIRAERANSFGKNKRHIREVVAQSLAHNFNHVYKDKENHYVEMASDAFAKIIEECL